MTSASAFVGFERVSKRFYRGVRHTTLSDAVPALLRRLVGRGASREPFWALRDVSFSVGAGEALGIIGPNGSGKSTILKLISGILRPDEGNAVVRAAGRGRGRVGALIELSAGFHYELSGRENIYLQGAVLGMRRRDIALKFDEIVAFGELGEFIDSPVKHYSSGMIARLGFSIAAHLEPDILLIDEVLAVGDLAFQQKAFARIQDVVRRGAPVVVVSHQLNQIMQLCDKAILLNRGRVICSGSAAECVAMYVGEGAPRAEDASPIQLTAITGPVPAHVGPGERVRLGVRGVVVEPNGGVDAAVGVRVRVLPREEIVFAAHTSGCGLPLPKQGSFDLEIDIQMNVGPGTYRAQAVAWDVRHGRELARGPSTLIGVDSQRSALGLVFSAPRMRFLDS
ncbi:MAG TPA: ABC transporter ATP-binding protein [Gemmatimonadaceae bacterium]|nr:ABC transporter ATP-binding protein [Gemmatimonadaceae bacterium]